MDFCGITSPANATSLSCSIVTGLVRKRIGFAAAHLFHCFPGVAQVAEVGLLAHLFGIQAQQPVENDGVQLRQVELALALRHIGQCRGHRFRLCAQQERARCGDRDEGRAFLALQRLQCNLARQPRAAAQR